MFCSRIDSSRISVTASIASKASHTPSSSNTTSFQIDPGCTTAATLEVTTAFYTVPAFANNLRTLVVPSIAPYERTPS